MKLFTFLTALVTLVTLATANPLSTTLDTRSIVHEFDVTFDYWEPIEMGFGNPSLTFGTATNSMANAQCLAINFIQHMNHITNLQVKDDEFCLFYRMDMCKTGGDPNNMFKSGPTANLRGSLKFEPKSVFCYSPRQAGSKSRSLSDESHLVPNLESRSVERPTGEPQMVEASAAKGSLTTREPEGLQTRDSIMAVRFTYKTEPSRPREIVRNQCYDALPNMQAIVDVDIWTICTFYAKNKCDPSGGQFSTQGQSWLEGKGFSPVSLSCWKPDSIPKRSLTIREPDTLLARESTITVTFSYKVDKSKPIGTVKPMAISGIVRNRCYIGFPGTEGMPFINSMDVDLWTICTFFEKDKCDPSGKKYTVQGSKDNVGDSMRFFPRTYSCWKPELIHK